MREYPLCPGCKSNQNWRLLARRLMRRGKKRVPIPYEECKYYCGLCDNGDLYTESDLAYLLANPPWTEQESEDYGNYVDQETHELIVEQERQQNAERDGTEQ